MTSGSESVERLETKVIYPVDFLGRRREEWSNTAWLSDRMRVILLGGRVEGVPFFSFLVWGPDMTTYE